MLDIRDVTIQYGKNKPVIEHFNLTVNEGEIVSIVGESGSGKTTVIQAMLGLLPIGGRITRGEILFDEQSLLGYTREQWRQFRARKVSMIFQDSGVMLNPIRKIGSQYVEYICAYEKVSKKEAWEKAVKMLERMKLPDGNHIMNSYPFQLSGGMRQRVGIAMAMTFQPQFLLADEPTSALDVTTQADIVCQMMKLRKEYNTGIVLVTHNIGVASYMADRIVVMKDGKIVDMGAAEDLLGAPKDEYTKNLLECVPTLEGERYV